MYLITKRKRKIVQWGLGNISGYIALMTSIMVGAILLVLTVGMSQTGWSTRYAILGTEAKEQALALAGGCAEYALARVLADPGYQGDATTTTPGGTCYVFPLEFNTPTAGLLRLRVQVIVRDSYTNLVWQFDLHDIHTGSVPVPLPLPPPPRTLDLSIESVSRYESAVMP